MFSFQLPKVSKHFAGKAARTKPRQLKARAKSVRAKQALKLNRN